MDEWKIIELLAMALFGVGGIMLKMLMSRVAKVEEKSSEFVKQSDCAKNKVQQAQSTKELYNHSDKHFEALRTDIKEMTKDIKTEIKDSLKTHVEAYHRE